MDLRNLKDDEIAFLLAIARCLRTSGYSMSIHKDFIDQLIRELERRKASRQTYLGTSPTAGRETRE